MAQNMLCCVYFPSVGGETLHGKEDAEMKPWGTSGWVPGLRNNVNIAIK